MTAIHLVQSTSHPRPSPNDLTFVGRAAENDTNYRDEFERLCSFPLENWNGTRPKHSLVIIGYYFCEPNLRCAFCSQVFDISADDLLTQHRNSCSMTENVPLGNVDNYYYERNRIVSFLVAQNWTAPVHPRDLAKDGFFWMGTDDATCCIFCRLQVRAWEQGDTAHGEHQKWNARCPFIQGRSTGNVPLGTSALASNGADDFVHLVKHSQPAKDPLNVHYMSGVPYEREEELGVMRKASARNPDYETFQSRLETYKSWPAGLKQRPSQLARAGFYYTSQGDRVICYHCGGGLKDWREDDDPWTEHATWFGHCPFLILAKGKKFINDVVKHKQQLEESTEESTDVNMETSDPYIISDPSVEIVDDKFKNIEITNNDSRKCQFCRERDIGVVLLPCGHMASCLECIEGKKNCPICHKTINAYVKAYIS